MNNRVSFNGMMKIANICFLMVLENFALDLGMGLLGAACVLFAWLYMLVFGGMQNTMAKIIASRVHNELYGNAGKVYRCLMMYSIVMGTVCAFLMFYFSDAVSNIFLKNTYGSPLLKLLAVLFFLNTIVDAMNGYYLGMEGDTIPYRITCLIRILLPFAAGIFLVKGFRDYGIKVSALLKEPLYTNVYASVGAVVVFIICSAVSLFVFILLIMRSGQNNRPFGDEIRKGIDSKRSILHSYFTTSISFLKNTVIFYTSGLGVTLLYFLIASQKGITVKVAAANFGMLTGKFFMLCLFPFLLYREFVIKEKMKIHTSVNKEEWKNVSLRIHYLLKNSFFILLPPTILLITLAEPIVKVLFSGDYIVSVKLLRIGGILLFLGGFSYTLDSILCTIKKDKQAFFIRLIGLVILILSLVGLLNLLNGSIFCIIYAFLIKYVIEMVLQFLLLKSVIVLRVEDIIGKLIRVIIALIVPAVVEMCLDYFVLMNIPILFLSILIGYLLYYIGIFLDKGITKRDELSLKKSFSYIPIHFISSKLGLW